MLWICRDCGHEIGAADAVLVTTIGWTALDGETGICPVCSKSPLRESSDPRTTPVVARRQRVGGALTVSRAMTARARETRADDPVLDAAAQRLGFTKVPCFACRGSGDPQCPNCEGVGHIWRSGVSTLARAGMLRLVRWPQNRGA